ncbi:hypothetical protein JCM19241_4962 [Vibrio ishigakensis]|uniref:Uncharacterized protein n=1 Tax=Vibrio ishigakensis TaxID=1481914 RepID=A0A0B8Q5F3_9VIBR|nr:hypothetical protein JCM19241_4962 [Vibrio ishigakensis]
MEHENAEVIESQITRRLLSLSTYIIGACVVFFVAWTVLTQVDEIAKAKGSVILKVKDKYFSLNLAGN